LVPLEAWATIVFVNREKPDMLIPAASAPRPHRLTVDDYYRMGETRILAPDARVELIDGEIFDMAPIGTRHAGAVEHLSCLLRLAGGQLAHVRTQNPVRLGPYSEPQPDIALVRPRDDFYKSAHPSATDVFLLVEVSDASLTFDRAVKAALYAGHGIPELWVVDLPGNTLTRYLHPDIAKREYAQIDVPDPDAPLVLHAVDVTVETGALFVAQSV
jgi:Uma2 family endonuclease